VSRRQCARPESGSRHRQRLGSATLPRDNGNIDLGMPRKRLLIVAATTGYQTRMFAAAAERVGADVTLATDRCHVLNDPWGDHAIPVRFEDPAGSVDAIFAEGPFDGVLAVADRPTLVAAMAAERLGVPYNSPASVEAASNKYLARQRYKAAG